ncbi:A-kinase anchor protein SPHKAP isoform X2 [Gadus macrocephalus]|uniref:A-kinase anchor protein SPHKAP isoform X2 n=1 Tax=Gadus macrocephalus TaxID=80720 RepID=UPI0028CBABD7|nr:A-kinase anchor protein SPHKAP isoform X2 [Gadus macrocephalus]
MMSSLLAALRAFTETNFQQSAMLEGSDITETEALTTDSTLASSVTACKKVLCSNSVLDSADYWLQNEKALCRLGLLDGDADGSCSTICFVNLDHEKMDYTDHKGIKRLASVSPDLPKMVESLNVHQPKENEILLLGGLQAPDIIHTRSQSSMQGLRQQQQRGPDVCLLQCSGRRLTSQPGNIILEINRFLIGLQWGKDRHLQQQQQPQQQQQGHAAAGARIEDDTNRSISSIEEDFLTASEHLEEDSEDDNYRNEPGSGGAAEGLVEVAQRHCVRPSSQRGQGSLRQDSEDEGTVVVPAKKGPHKTIHNTKESAGHYATNLAESVLQDAFIRLSQDETSFIPGAAVSLSLCPIPSNSTCSASKREGSQQRTCSFELPKIVIVQSPDSSEGAAEWPGIQTVQSGEEDDSVEPQPLSEQGSQPHKVQHNGGHPSKPVEVALAYAASVIGTIANPQLTEQITMESSSEEDTGEEQQESEDGADYSFSSAMAKLAGAVAGVDLTEESGEGGDSDADSNEVYTTSRGLMSAAEASAAFTLHCSVTEGTSIEAFRANIAEVLHREAAEVLAQPEGYKSVAHLLEVTHNKIVDGITCPKKSYVDDTEVDDFLSEVVDSLFKHAFEKAKKKKELEGPGKDAPNLQVFLQESVNNLLFDILCLTHKKISDISRCSQAPFDMQECDVYTRDSSSTKEIRDPAGQMRRLVGYSQAMLHCTDTISMALMQKDGEYLLEERETKARKSSPAVLSREQQQQMILLQKQQLQCQTKTTSPLAKDCADHQQMQPGKGAIREPLSEISVACAERRGRLGTSGDSRQGSLTPQSSLNSCSSLLSFRMDSETRTPVSCFADDLATTVVSMATELAAICLENSTGKQPWFCGLKGAPEEGHEAILLPACRTVLRRKEGQNGNNTSKKHRAPRLSEIKRKTEEQPELMECLVNRVVDETVNPDEPQDPFALFASEVTARIMNCPELNVVDTSKAGQPRSRLQCERWSRGKASSYESIPEEDGDPLGRQNTLGPGSRLGQNLSRGSSISKQSSCESITDEFSRFMVNQMETEGRGFDLLLDYYAGKNASSILAAAVQQAATKKNGHLNVRASCLSKQSSTESITEEFYRFMLKDMDKENKDYSFTKTKEWSNSLLPPSPRTSFCIRQSSVPDRRSSDSRLTVGSPIKANSFDGFARNSHGDTLNIYPSNSVSASGLCKSDSCLYQRGRTDQITDMLIHETWSSSIESLMRKNKIIADPEDSIELGAAAVDSQPQVQQFANRLAADIVETGKSFLGGQPEGAGSPLGWQQTQPRMPVGERRRGFKQSRPGCSRSKGSQEQAGTGDATALRLRCNRDVPLIHIEGDQKDAGTSQDPMRVKVCRQDVTPEVLAPKHSERISAGNSSSERPAGPVAALVKRDKRSMSASSEESMGSWSQVTPEEDPPDETSSFIQLSEGNGTSSASSVGMADLEAFSDVASQSAIAISAETGRGHLAESQGSDLEEAGLVRSMESVPMRPRGLLVLNYDLEQECVDWELRVTLQWIAASELGLSALYFSKSKEKRVSKFQKVVLLLSQKAWRVADLFAVVLQFCEFHEKEREEGRSSLSSLFDWLLETL